MSRKHRVLMRAVSGRNYIDRVFKRMTLGEKIVHAKTIYAPLKGVVAGKRMMRDEGQERT